MAYMKIATSDHVHAKSPRWGQVTRMSDISQVCTPGEKREWLQGKAEGEERRVDGVHHTKARASVVGL